MTDLFQLGLYRILHYPAENSTVYIAIVTVLCAVAASVIPYLLGSLNTAVIVSRLVYHDDVRHHGSGNAGLTNTLRTFGKKAALLVLAGDILKTVLAVFAGGLFMGMGYVGPFALFGGGYIGAFFCIMGHVWPVYYRFKGGKGVLCSAISGLVLCPVVFAVILVVFVIIVAFTKYVSLGSVMSALMFPLFYHVTFRAFFGDASLPWYSVLFTFFVAAFLTYLHRANIKRLIQGEESKLSFAKKTEPSNNSNTYDGESDEAK